VRPSAVYESPTKQPLQDFRLGSNADEYHQFDLAVEPDDRV